MTTRNVGEVTVITLEGGPLHVLVPVEAVVARSTTLLSLTEGVDVVGALPSVPFSRGDGECKGPCSGVGAIEILVGENEDACKEDSDEGKNALAAAQKLAESREAYWKKVAKRKADAFCRLISGSDECSCEGGIYKPYKKVSRYPWSGRCWAYYGWEYTGECKSEA